MSFLSAFTCNISFSHLNVYAWCALCNMVKDASTSWKVTFFIHVASNIYTFLGSQPILVDLHWIHHWRTHNPDEILQITWKQCFMILKITKNYLKESFTATDITISNFKYGYSDDINWLDIAPTVRSMCNFYLIIATSISWYLLDK